MLSNKFELIPEPALSVELVNRCNLHCGYCLRDEDALYHDRPEFFSPELLEKILAEAHSALNLALVLFTGGEVTMHPRFGEIVQTVATRGFQFGFVTNGWLFDRVYPVLVENIAAVRLVAFSLDGTTVESHDRWRGNGSFVRVIRAMTLCRAAKIPFVIKVCLRRDTAPHLQEFALFGARLGAARLDFAHLLPGSATTDRDLALSQDERRDVEHEIAILSNIFKMKVTITTGYYNIDPAVPCASLRAEQPNIDYKGRLTLCCNLSGYRGAAGESDVLADLKTESFVDGYERLRTLAALQVTRRRKALDALHKTGAEPDLSISSPCMFCLKSFSKIPWHSSPANHERNLPVLPSHSPQVGS